MAVCNLHRSVYGAAAFSTLLLMAPTGSHAEPVSIFLAGKTIWCTLKHGSESFEAMGCLVGAPVDGVPKEPTEKNDAPETTLKIEKVSDVFQAVTQTREYSVNSSPKTVGAEFANQYGIEYQTSAEVGLETGINYAGLSAAVHAALSTGFASNIAHSRGLDVSVTLLPDVCDKFFVQTIEDRQIVKVSAPGFGLGRTETVVVTVGIDVVERPLCG